MLHGDYRLGNMQCVGTEIRALIDLTTGARVRGSQMGGAFAEQAVLPHDHLSALPTGMSFAEGASFGVTGRTACAALAGVAEASGQTLGKVVLEMEGGRASAG